MEIKKLKRKPFDVDAVQVTEENMREVAEWCNGELRTITSGQDAGTYIKVKVRYPLNDRQTQAWPSDWVLASQKGYKVYTDNAIRHSFNFAEDEEDELQELRVTAESADEVQPSNVFDNEGPLKHGTTVSDEDSISGKNRSS